MMSLGTCFWLIAGLLVKDSWCDTVLGCGGFIREGPSDLSRVEVELRSKEGKSLKYKTDPAPNNGYYFLPIYEKGDYVLKVKPPKSWEMEPEEIPVSVNGVDDPCTLNRDLDFTFKGFAISGRILSKGSDLGPRGVSLELTDSEGKVSSASTREGGIFSFKGVSPGEYSLKAKDNRYQFESSIVKVSIDDEAKFSKEIVVSGYDVKGKVLIGKEPLSKFTLKLADQTAETDSSGEFLFKTLPIGTYDLKPLREDSVNVASSVFKVDNTLHRHLTLETPFVITGFTLASRVLGVKTPSSVEIKVTSTDEKDLLVKANSAGDFYLKNIKKQKYILKPVLDGYDFEDVELNVLGPEFSVPRIKPSRFRVSGKVERDGLGSNAIGEIKVKFVNEEGKLMGKVLVSDKGFFSIYLPPGKVSASVEIAVEDRRKGIGGFAPVEHVVNVKDEPISNIEFTSIKVTVSGNVNTFDKGMKTTILLSSVDLEDVVLSAKVIDGKFKFTDVLPGTYTASLAKETGDSRCWAVPSLKMSVSEDITDLSFDQKGYEVEVSTSHKVEVSLSNGQTFKLNAGLNTVCVESRSESIIVEPKESCHKFSVSPSTINFPNPRKIKLEAKSHKVSGYVMSKNLIPDLQIKVMSRAKEEPLKIPHETKDGKSHFTFFANSQEDFQIIPKAKEHLFEPERLHLSVERDCMLDAIIFQAREGIFIRGNIYPSLEGVKISVSDTLYGYSNVKGTYQIGPLPGDENFEYPISAEKSGYAFEEGEKYGDFNARKLASIEVSIYDGEEPLSSVLVSISGRENYRNRSITKDGVVSFLMLEPGEYFVKPMISEYEFEPKNQLLKVKEGDSQKIKIKALRVAFSCYGKMLSLNGDPEQGVVVVASGESSDCDSSEATSNSTGHFRIRGLVPGCRYTVSLMKGLDQDLKIETLIPKSVPISVKAKDIEEELKFIAVTKFPSTDITLFVKNDQPFTPIKVRFSSVNDDSVHVTKKDVSDRLILFPSVPLDSQKQYYLSVETVNEKFSANKKTASRQVSANSTFKSILLELEKVETKLKSVKSNKFWLILLFPLSGMILFRAKLMELINYGRVRN